MLANVSPDGRVLNVSGGTAVMKDADGYRGISRDWIRAGVRVWRWRSLPVC